MEEVRPILEWAQVHLADLKAIYVTAIQNQLADDLSRIFIIEQRVVPQSSSLSSPYLQMVNSRYGSGGNSREQQMSLIPSEGRLSNSSRDRLSSPPMGISPGLYFSPPIPLIAIFLARLRNSTSTVIAVLPFWLRRPWFATVLQLNTEEPLPLPVSPDLL